MHSQTQPSAAGDDRRGAVRSGGEARALCAQRPGFSAAATSSAPVVAGGAGLGSAVQPCSFAVSCGALLPTDIPPDAHPRPVLSSLSLKRSELYSGSLWPTLFARPPSLASFLILLCFVRCRRFSAIKRRFVVVVAVSFA